VNAGSGRGSSTGLCHFGAESRKFLQSTGIDQHNALATQTVEKALGVKHHAANTREFAVEILNFE
jgi:hypothetical protein